MKRVGGELAAVQGRGGGGVGDKDEISGSCVRLV